MKKILYVGQIGIEGSASCTHVQNRARFFTNIGYNVYGLKEDVELDDDEYFYDDLIGCQIINNDQEIGKVESVYFNGAHDVLTVQTANKKIAIPYVDAFIENEDIENKKIFVHLIKGMYDED